MSQIIRSPEYLDLELHLMNEHSISASETMQLEDLGLQIRHALLHANEKETN